MVEGLLFLKEEWRVGRIKQKFSEDSGWILGKVHELSKHLYLYIFFFFFQNITVKVSSQPRLYCSPNRLDYQEKWKKTQLENAKEE